LVKPISFFRFSAVCNHLIIIPIPVELLLWCHHLRLKTFYILFWRGFPEYQLEKLLDLLIFLLLLLSFWRGVTLRIWLLLHKFREYFWPNILLRRESILWFFNYVMQVFLWSWRLMFRLLLITTKYYIRFVSMQLNFFVMKLFLQHLQPFSRTVDRLISRLSFHFDELVLFILFLLLILLLSNATAFSICLVTKEKLKTIFNYNLIYPSWLLTEISSPQVAVSLAWSLNCSSCSPSFLIRAILSLIRWFRISSLQASFPKRFAEEFYIYFRMSMISFIFFIVWNFSHLFDKSWTYCFSSSSYLRCKVSITTEIPPFLFFL
jgi:hypothetical protein